MVYLLLASNEVPLFNADKDSKANTQHSSKKRIAIKLRKPEENFAIRPLS